MAPSHGCRQELEQEQEQELEQDRRGGKDGARRASSRGERRPQAASTTGLALRRDAASTRASGCS